MTAPPVRFATQSPASRPPRVVGGNAAGSTAARGFTLLEVLIAIAENTANTAMAYGGLMRLLDNRERIETERAFWRGTALGFVRIEQDLSAVINRPIRDNGGVERPAFLGQPTDARALGEPNLEFTRAGVAATGGATTDLQRVGYRLENGRLLRLAWPVVDRAPLSQPAATPVLRDVEEFNVRFRYAGAWLDRWPPAVAAGNVPALPNAVELTVAIKNRGAYTRTLLVGSER